MRYTVLIYNPGNDVGVVCLRNYEQLCIERLGEAPGSIGLVSSEMIQISMWIDFVMGQSYFLFATLLKMLTSLSTEFYCRIGNIIW